MKHIKGLERGMGIGGWLTNYKRFNVLPEHRRMDITVGDMEHFESYITESDIEYIASLGMDHVRLGFDQIVVEEAPFVYRERIISLLHDFVLWCKKYSLRPVLNMHKAIGNYCDIRESVSLLDSPELRDRFVAFWCMLEDEFSADGEVAFELLNEVRDVEPEKWNSLAEATLKAIRNKNSERLVIIGSTCWNSPDRLAALRIFDDENVIYTFHFYAPLEFTHQQGVLQADQLYYNRKMPYPEPAELSHPFYTLPNCFLTPHIAGSLGGEVVRMAEYMANEFESYVSGVPCKYEVNLKMLETMA